MIKYQSIVLRMTKAFFINRIFKDYLFVELNKKEVLGRL